jgi:hypothetical protein
MTGMWNVECGRENVWQACERLTTRCVHLPAKKEVVAPACTFHKLGHWGSWRKTGQQKHGGPATEQGVRLVHFGGNFSATIVMYQICPWIGRHGNQPRWPGQYSVAS